MSVKATLSTRSTEGLDRELTHFLLDIGRRCNAVSDLADGSTTAQCVTKINEILAALRDADKMAGG